MNPKKLSNIVKTEKYYRSKNYRVIRTSKNRFFDLVLISSTKIRLVCVFTNKWPSGVDDDMLHRAIYPRPIGCSKLAVCWKDGASKPDVKSVPYKGITVSKFYDSKGNLVAEGRFLDDKGKPQRKRIILVAAKPMKSLPAPLVKAIIKQASRRK